MIPLEKFKPLFDSFQADFKDEYRFFAGLYLFYRFIMLQIYAASTDLPQFYFNLGIFLAIVLIIHGFIQPYKKSYHNKLDLFVFGMLTVINGITAHNYDLMVDPNLHDRSVKYLTIQVVLGYLPLVVLIVYAVKRLNISAKVWKKFVKSKKEEDNTDYALAFLDEKRHKLVSDEDYNADYKRMKN